MEYFAKNWEQNLLLRSTIGLSKRVSPGLEARRSVILHVLSIVRGWVDEPVRPKAPPGRPPSSQSPGQK
eukprot:2290916-Amphidinium_carterae.1